MAEEKAVPCDGWPGHTQTSRTSLRLNKTRLFYAGPAVWQCGTSLQELTSSRRGRGVGRGGGGGTQSSGDSRGETKSNILHVPHPCEPGTMLRPLGLWRLLSGLQWNSVPVKKSGWLCGEDMAVWCLLIHPLCVNMELPTCFVGIRLKTHMEGVRKLPAHWKAVKFFKFHIVILCLIPSNKKVKPNQRPHFTKQPDDFPIIISYDPALVF